MHRSFTPRSPKSAEERLPQLYRGLVDQVNDGYFQNAIKTCRKILTLDPKSRAGFQTLLFLHLQTDEYSAALDLVVSYQDESELQFERAYCLYRLHREREALKVLEAKIGEKGRRELHLEGQIRYRIGEYEKTRQIYDELLAGCSPSSPEHPDILTNLASTASHLDFLSHDYHSVLASTSLSEVDLETNVPSLPAGWSTGGDKVETKPAIAKNVEGKEKAKQKKRKHKLPKGATEVRQFTEDPERWIPLRQRQSYAVTMSKKKGAKESMGTGFTQGSTTSQGHSGSGNTGGGKKKGKKK
ncbi:hypothetical protein TREMEDRAFT_68788 [Tremella mesenterica DSM 1558]|uniref:uncharacterized protein n=1 Tax=Tremella mesenterica (strain ATCC 24925 / CBS 8224 / DSM 1558 / NBRC 9311 / NRRL Y-6157 / RJB 2259-6 / UBC 559-6) TaxID=578456 RepID=UPI0003F4A0C0|nr:uncharacterized protein TREMEDRAFT_68788 [Tremella mesenterica DSM 1558]EIW69627.1 hypothetical protein TREMEDRAFT_68788 [Tremella mesenterica DSM 1558]